MFQGLLYSEDLNDNRTELQLIINEVKVKYFKYLESECGEIQFDGLPTDNESGSIKVKLENIFVPLYLNNHKTRTIRTSQIIASSLDRISVGSLIATEKKIAVLAKPGGGKSTLIKRLAIAYAYPERRQLISDDLPDLSLFPIFIRCRELGDQVNNTITDIINNIPLRAEIASVRSAFISLSSDYLQKGNALLLIDGLDEIADERTRILFVHQLRTFLSTYPNLYVIVTSREAGFRNISGVLSEYCTQYTLSNLSSDEITELTVKWHKVIIDDSTETIEDAQSLSSMIIKDSKIRILATNPLLLTTLLFVKRWVGYLPTKRSILYQEMIKLLLATWNVEGHEQLDIDETEPQLAYVAFWMMQKGTQSITADELKTCLAAARKQMPDILNYTKISIPNFIKRVESRSSLLIMSGHQQTINGLIPVYEFLHLSFQEYLTAKAIVENYLPESEIDKTYLNIIEPYLTAQNWKEVIPLIAVLLKRQSKTLIEYLINIINTNDQPYSNQDNRRRKSVHPRIPKLLGSCIANEIQITPEILDKALECYVKYIDDDDDDDDDDVIYIIFNSKFRENFYNKTKQALVNERDNTFNYQIAGTLARLAYLSYTEKTTYNLFMAIKKDILQSDIVQKCLGILALMQLAFEMSNINEPSSSNTEQIEVDVSDIAQAFFDILENDDNYLAFSVCWALVWSIHINLINHNEVESNKLATLLLKKWLFSKSIYTSRMASWALIKFMRLDLSLENSKEVIEKIEQLYIEPKNEFDSYAAIYTGTNLNLKWDISELRNKFNEAPHNVTNSKSYIIYANFLGVFK